MATLAELLGQPISPEDTVTSSLEDIFNSGSLKPIRDPYGESKQGVQSLQPLEVPTGNEDKGRLVWETLGLPAYSFLDMALFNVPGLLIPDKIEEEYLTPKTTIGKVSSAIGGTAGFVYGAPMKLGAKATQMLAKPFIKKAGAETIEQVIKRTADDVASAAHKSQFGTKAKMSIIKKDVKKTISSLSHTHRWDKAGKGVAKNFNQRATDAVSNLVDGAVKSKNLTAKEGLLLKQTIAKNVTARPMQDFVDIVMARNPNKYGFVVGSIINEGAMFGMIDAALEYVHSTAEDRDYDWTAPLFGVGVGGAFGFLKLLPAAGKSSISGEDFRSGVKAVFNKNHFNKMGKKKLVENAKIIGNSLKDNGYKSTIKVGDTTIDLANPITSQGTVTAKKALENLQKGLNQERVKYGREMMKESVKEDFKSSLANWKRILLGTGIMNVRSAISISQGHEMDPVDIMTSLMIGAWLNRKGIPLTPEMNMNKMQRIRRGLHEFGVPQQRLYDTVPTLHESQFGNINPLTDRTFSKINKKAEELGLMGNTPETVETSNSKVQNSPTLAASQRAFPLFDKYYLWLQSASPKKYKKPKALVTEAEAKAIEAEIRANDFDGKKINTSEDFDFMMQSIKNKITDNVEHNITKTVHDMIKITKWGNINTPDMDNLGTIPKNIVIDVPLLNRIEAGKVENMTLENVMKYQGKAQKVLKSVQDTMKGTASENTDLVNAVIKNEAQLKELINVINTGENNMIKTFNIHKRGATFEYGPDLDDLIHPVLQRRVQKGNEALGNKFSDTENPTWNEKMLPELEASGLIIKDPESVYGYRLLDANNVTIIKPEGWAGGNETAIMRSVLGILGAKGNKSLGRDNTTEVEVTVAQMQRLEEFLNREGIATQKELLDFFRANTTQQLFFDIARDTRIEGRDVAILNQLAGLGIPMAQYSTLADGGTGFTIRKIDTIGVPKDKRFTVYKAVREYNTYVDGLIKRGTSKKDKKQLISPGRTINFKAGEFGKGEALILRDILRRVSTVSQQNAQNTIIDFVRAMDSTDPMSIGIKKYLENANDPDALFNFLQGEGLIVPKKKKGVIDYTLNSNMYKSDPFRHKLEEWLTKFGVSTNEIEKMNDVGNQVISNILNTKLGSNHGTMSQQQYFEKYFPDATGVGSRYQEAEVQKVQMDKALASPNPLRSLIENMEVKVGNDLISGKDILRKGIYTDKLIEVKDDTQKLLVLRQGSETVDIIGVNQNKVIPSKKNMQRNPFLNFFKSAKIPFVFVDGTMYSQYYTGKRLRATEINVFEMDSPHSVNSYSNTGQNQKLVDNFYDTIIKHNWEGTDHKGIQIIRMGNAKDALAVPTTSYNEIKDLFKIEIYDTFVKSTKGKTRDNIEGMMKELNESSTWGPAHEDALRSVMIKRMVTGKGDPNKFIKLIESGASELAELGKRFSLYHTPSFKRMDKELMMQLALNSTGADKKLLENFMKRDVGFLVWNDKGMADIKSDPNTQKLLSKKKSSWTKMLGNRKSESGFDSISFISQDFKRILELYYGVSKKGSNIFKPVVSSTGEDYLLLGKTVFVHDPDIQAEIFGKHKGLDFLMTRSADKMKSSISDAEWANLPKSQQDRIRYVDKTIDEMLNITTSEVRNYLKTISMDKIGVTIMPDVDMLAKQSYSIPNYMNNSEQGEYYNAFYKSRIDRLLGGSANTGEGYLRKLTQDNAYKRATLLQLKGTDFKQAFDDIGNTPESLKNLGHHVQVAAMGGDIRMMGEDVLYNTLNSQLIQPLLSPQSIKGEQIYGGKAVIKQSFKFRDLDITVRTGEGKENTKVDPGELMLPNNSRSGSIDFKEADIVLKVVGPKGEIKDAKDLLNEHYKKKPPTIKKGRVGKPIYEVKVDMFEHPTLKSGDGEPADVWVVNSLAEAKAQLKAIKSGRGQGKNFRKIEKVGPGEWVLKTKRNKDNKLIFLKGKEPLFLTPDQKGRVKGKLYRKEVIKADKTWEYLQKNGDLGQLHDTIERLFKGKWQLGILTTRYPRTAPNDLAILKLKGFLKKEHGNTSIVNDFDVLNIFEGDYDVDEIDFFWGMNRKTWDHVGRVKHHWVNTVDKSFYESKTPELALMDKGLSNSQWNQFDGNNRMFGKGIGIVQKTPRLLNHLNMIGVKNEKTGERDIIRYENSKGEEVVISLDYDNSNYFERMALESQLIIDYWKGVSPDVVNGMVDWRNNYLFPTYERSITKDKVQSLADRLAVKQGESRKAGPENTRIRLFRKRVNGKEGSQYDLAAEEIAVLQHLLSKHSDFLSLTTEVYDNSGRGRNPSYNDIYSTSNDYFNGHLKNLAYSAYTKVRSKFKNSEIIDEMFKPLTFKRAWVDKKIENLNKFNKREEAEALRKAADSDWDAKIFTKYTFQKNVRHPFMEGVIGKAMEISQSNGPRGSVMERFYREVLHRDPFNHNSNKNKTEIPLKGEMYEEMMFVTSQLMNEYSGLNSKDNISDILPKMTGKFNQDVGIIKHYKRTVMQILNNKQLTKNVKDKRVAALKDIITEKEANLKELLPKKYLETGQIKYLEKLKMVDVSRDQDVIEGTVQWYTMHGLADRWGISKDMNQGNFIRDLNEAIVLGAKYYNEFNEMGQTSEFGNQTIHGSELKQMRMNPNTDLMSVEAHITDRLERGYADYNMPFLINYAMPNTVDTNIGVFNHGAIPISSKPTGRLKRVVKFMLDKMNTTTDKVEKLDMKEALEVLIKRYSSYRNYFDGNFSAIPTTDRDMMNILNNPPGFSDNLKTVFDRYEKIQIQQGKFAQDVFGMGSEYDNNVMFYRRLLEEGIGNSDKIALKEATSTLSYTNQLLMENGYMDPITYYLNVKNVRRELERLGLDKAETMGVDGGEYNALSIHSKESQLAVLAGQKAGISIRPMQLMTDYRLSMIQKFIKQGKDLKKQEKSSREWGEFREEYNKKGYCKPNTN